MATPRWPRGRKVRWWHGQRWKVCCGRSRRCGACPWGPSSRAVEGPRKLDSRGRDSGRPLPPAQIRTSGFPAYYVASRIMWRPACKPRESVKTLGNFWVDLVRTTYYLLLPICLVFAVVLVSQGMIQNFKAYTKAKLTEPYTTQVAKTDAKGQPVTTNVVVMVQA